MALNKNPSTKAAVAPSSELATAAFRQTAHTCTKVRLSAKFALLCRSSALRLTVQLLASLLTCELTPHSVTSEQSLIGVA